MSRAAPGRLSLRKPGSLPLADTKVATTGSILATYARANETTAG